MQLAGLTIGTLLLVVILRALLTLGSRGRQQAKVARVDQEQWLARANAKSAPMVSSAAWHGPRTFVIEGVSRETEDVLSIYLGPQDRKPLPPFEPGQFIALSVPIPETKSSIRRCYSLSRAYDPSFYRITVKRMPGGVGSNYLHNESSVGTTLQVFAPAGRFVLDTENQTPLVLVAGGIGITPLLGMLDKMAYGHSRPTTLFYSVRSGREHACRDEIKALEARCSWLRVITIYTRPEAVDVPGIDYDDDQRLTVDAIRAAVSTLAADFYLCGSAEMIQSLTGELIKCGVSPAAIRSEGFGGRPNKRAVEVGVECTATAATNQPERLTTGHDTEAESPAQLTFKISGKTVAYDNPSETILECAERHGVELDSMCRAGSCGSCQVKVKAGRVESANGTPASQEPGTCLPCVARPAGDIVLHA